MKYDDFFKSNKARWGLTGVLIVLLLATAAYQNTIFQNKDDNSPLVLEEGITAQEEIILPQPEPTNPAQQVIAGDNSNSVEDITTDDLTNTEPSEPVNDEQISWIFPLNGEIGRNYGYNLDPTFEDYRFHHGIDIMAEPGTPIYAVAEGKVLLARVDGAWGGVLTLDHENGWQSIYRCIETTLQHGDYPKAGEIIGYIIEAAPREAGQEAHLHFELLQDDENVDPEKWL